MKKKTAKNVEQEREWYERGLITLEEVDYLELKVEILTKRVKKLENYIHFGRS